MSTTLESHKKRPMATKRKCLLMLHGLLGQAANWNETEKHFKGQYLAQSYAFHLYGNGAPFNSVASLTEQTIKEINRLEAEKAVIFGNSMGGQIALNVALKHPDRVAGMVLCGSAGLLERDMSSQAPLDPPREYVYDRVREVFYDARHATDELVDEVQTLLKDVKNKLRLVKLARSLRSQNLYDHLPEIEVPTLLIWGKQDTITPVDVAETFAKRMPRARLEVLDECGHAPNIEQPKQFNALSEKFLKDIGYT